VRSPRAGRLVQDETTPVEIITRRRTWPTGQVDVKTRTVDTDEGARRRFDLESAVQAQAGVRRQALGHAPTARRCRTGAGALLVVSEKILREHNLTRCQVSSFAVKGVRPRSWASAEAGDPAACAAAGITQDQLDWIELNESIGRAGAGVIGVWGSTPPRSTDGGAIALGHPLGATGCNPRRDR